MAVVVMAVVTTSARKSPEVAEATRILCTASIPALARIASYRNGPRGPRQLTFARAGYSSILLFNKLINSAVSERPRARRDCGWGRRRDRWSSQQNRDWRRRSEGAL